MAAVVMIQPAPVKEVDIDDYINPLIETYGPNMIDSCTVLLERLEEESLLRSGTVPEEDFHELFQLLLSIEPEPYSYQEELLQELIERAKQAFAVYLHFMDELPEDVDPSFIWDEIDTLTISPALRDAAGDIFDTAEPTDSSVFDVEELEIQLLHEKLPPIPLVLNRRVERAISYFKTRGRKVMQKWLDRSAEMIPIILPILEEEGMPEDLVYLSMIESGFKTNAYSYAHASGPWQFISATGRKFGLDIDWWYDERRDPELSTRAAAAYLRTLYKMFDDWYLAMAAYNCGEGKVRRHVRQYGGDYWSLQRLPRQTRNYMPTFIAATIIAKNPEVYGFHKPEQIQPIETVSVVITECVDLGALAEAAGIDNATLRELNPAIVRWCTPPNRDSVTINLPAGFSCDSFLEKYAQIPAEKKVSYIRHRVRSGETLSTIARRYGIPMSMIIRHPKNRIYNKHRIRAGQVLFIPGISPDRAKRATNYESDPNDLIPTSDVHVVSRGETLSGIASRYGVTVSQLKRLNRLYGKRYIYPNQRLRIPESSQDTQDTQISALSGRKITRHIVTRGDSLWLIARKYGVSVEALRRANGLQGRSLIKPGQRLTIPTSN